LFSQCRKAAPKKMRKI